MQSKKIGIKIVGANNLNGLKNVSKFLMYLENVGFNSIEIRIDDFELIKYGELNEKLLKSLKSLLEDFDFEISVHAPMRLNLFNLEWQKLHEKVLISSIEICKFLNSKFFVYHPGRYVDDVEFPRFGKPYIDMVKKDELMSYERETIISIAKKYKDIIIAMENLRPYIDYSPFSYAEFIDELVLQVKKINQENVGITIDTGHLNLSSNYFNFDIIDALKKVKPFTKHIHLQDNHGITSFYTEKDKPEMLPFGRGDEHLIPSEGNFNFKDFFKIFKEYEGIYLLELTLRFLVKEKIKEAFKIISDFIVQEENDEQ